MPDKYTQDQFKRLVEELTEFQDRMAEAEGKMHVHPMTLEEWSEQIVAFADLKKTAVGKLSGD